MATQQINMTPLFEKIEGNQFKLIKESGHADVEWICPHCHRSTLIGVEIESPSDYYPETSCEYCGKEIQDSKLDDKISQEVVNYIVGRAENRRDSQQDR